MARREIDAPEQDWLSEARAARYLHVSLDLFRALAKAGFIPVERRLNRQTKLYHWKGLVIASWRMELGDMPSELE